MITGSLLGAAIGTAAAYGATQKEELRKRLHFVENDELQSELKKLDIDIDERETCVECGDRIAPHEIGLVFRENGDYHIVCDDPECLDTYDLESRS